MIIIDSGNTNCKIWIGEKKIVKQYADTFSDEKIILFKSEMQNPVAYSTVAPKKFESIVEFLKSLGFKTFVDVGELVKSEKLLGDEVVGIGADRILGMIGAATFLKAPLITVDCGTAITVNFLKEKKLCLGGAIFAGYSTQIRSLTSGTEGIRFEENAGSNRAIGKTTNEALHSGILNSITGGVQLLREKFLKESRAINTEMAITGGDGEKIATELLKENVHCIFKNDLIKLGIEDVFKNMSEIEMQKYKLK